MKNALVKTLFLACALVGSSLPTSAQTQVGEAACRADFMKFCPQASIKNSDMIACLKAKQPQFSDVCKKELQARAAAGFTTGQVGSPLQ